MDDPEEMESSELKASEEKGSKSRKNKKSALNEGVINKGKQKEEKKRTDLIGGADMPKDDSKAITIDEEFFSNEIIPLVHGVVSTSIPQESMNLLSLIFAFDVGLKKKTIQMSEYRLFWKHFLKIPQYNEWTDFDKDFVKITNTIDEKYFTDLLADLLDVYKELSTILNNEKFTNTMTQNEINIKIHESLTSLNFEKLPLIEQLNISLLFRDLFLKSILSKFVHAQLNDVVEISYEPMKFHKFIKTASWPLPIMVHTADDLNIVNIICSIASFYNVGLEVLRTDDDISMQKGKIKEEIELKKKYWPYENIHINTIRDLIETDDKRQTFTIHESLELIKECALQGSWVLVSTSKIVSYWDKICELLEELHKESKTAHSFRLFIDWQFMNLHDMPENLLFDRGFVFYLGDSNADDMEGYNDVWAHILNSNILKVSVDNSKRFITSGIKIDTEQKTIILSGVSSKLSSTRNDKKPEIAFDHGQPKITSANLSAISHKSYQNDSILHGKGTIIDL